MITNFSFSNYKSFKSGSIDLKPITILLGSNSSGKTSIAQILLLMQQTITNLNYKYKAALKLNGKYVNMGYVDNLFLDKETNKSLTFTFDFCSDSLLKLIRYRLQRDFEQYLTFVVRMFDDAYPLMKTSAKYIGSSIKQNSIKKLKDLLFLPLFYSKRDEGLGEYIEPFCELMDFIKKNNVNMKDRRFILPGSDNREFEFPKNQNDIKNNFHFLKEIRGIKSSNFKFEYTFYYDKEDTQLYIEKIILKNEDRRIIELLFSKKTNIIINSESDYAGKDIMAINTDIINKYIYYKHSIKDIFNNHDQKKHDNIFVYTIMRILSFATEDLSRYFNDTAIYHISPLRAEPKRFYFLDKANLDSMTGDSLTELLKDNDQLLEKANRWLNILGITLSVTQFKEIIHRLTVTPNGLKFDLDITDVGFGISQVLPIIVLGYLAQNNSITIIEQPEIHLHPKMQAGLADLFIDIVSSKIEMNKMLLIETHSEYLLKRLRRRIAEKKIKSTDVALYFLNPRTKEKGAKIDKIKINKKGAFEWPKEFYIDDLEDIQEFLKNQ